MSKCQSHNKALIRQVQLRQELKLQQTEVKLNQDCLTVISKTKISALVIDKGSSVEFREQLMPVKQAPKPIAP